MNIYMVETASSMTYSGVANYVLATSIEDALDVARQNVALMHAERYKDVPTQEQPPLPEVAYIKRFAIGVWVRQDDAAMGRGSAVVTSPLLDARHVRE